MKKIILIFMVSIAGVLFAKDSNRKLLDIYINTTVTLGDVREVEYFKDYAYLSTEEGELIKFTVKNNNVYVEWIKGEHQAGQIILATIIGVFCVAVMSYLFLE